MRKAIIATPTDGTKEVIRHEGNGLLVPFDDVHALAKSMIAMYEDRDLKEIISLQAQKYVADRFNAKRVAKSVLEIYMKLH